jgi:hypothetical protein
MTTRSGNADKSTVISRSTLLFIFRNPIRGGRSICPGGAPAGDHERDDDGGDPADGLLAPHPGSRGHMVGGV